MATDGEGTGPAGAGTVAAAGAITRGTAGSWGAIRTAVRGWTITNRRPSCRTIWLSRSWRKRSVSECRWLAISRKTAQRRDPRRAGETITDAVVGTADSTRRWPDEA